MLVVQTSFWCVLAALVLLCDQPGNLEHLLKLQIPLSYLRQKMAPDFFSLCRGTNPEAGVAIQSTRLSRSL